MSIVTMDSTGQPLNSHIIVILFSLDYLYLAGKTLYLVMDRLVNFRAILPETSKVSAYWDMCRNSNLKWLLPCIIAVADPELFFGDILFYL